MFIKYAKNKKIYNYNIFHFSYVVNITHTLYLLFQPVASNSLYAPELNATLKKISDNLIITELQEGENCSLEGRLMPPSCSQLIDLTKPETLHGLAERIVAVESLIFLSRQYQLLQEYLEYLVPSANKIMLQQFFVQVSFFVSIIIVYNIST